MIKFLTPFCLLALTACQSVPSDPVPPLPSMKATTENTALRFQDDAGAAGLVKVQLPSGQMRVGTMLSPISPSVANKPVKITQLPDKSTVADVMGMVQHLGVAVAFRWKNGDGTEILEKRAPFTRYDGTVGGLLDTLRRSAGVVSFQEGGTIFISDADKYSITLPQNEDILKSAASNLEALGAKDPVVSLDTGTIIYSAGPDLQVETLEPYLTKLRSSLATINMQVAIVSLALNDKFSQGFDWSKLQVALDQQTGRNGTGTGTGTGFGNNGSNGISYDRNGNPISTGNGTDVALQNAVENIVSGTGIAINVSKGGTLFGEAVVKSVSGAIDFLSSFGTTNITQHADLRTVSGKPVEFFSGQQIPYVSDVSTTSVYGNNSVTGGTNTETVDVGLKVEMTPRFEPDSGLVTVDLKLDLSSVIEFVELSGGQSYGKFYQPRTQNQTLTDIVRMRAGQTVVLGGLQYDQQTTTGTEPSFLRDKLKRKNLSVGSRGNETSRSALFVIMRPVVTQYDDGSTYARSGSPSTYGGLSK